MMSPSTGLRTTCAGLVLSLLSMPASAQIEIADGLSLKPGALELAPDGSLLIAHGAPGARLLSGNPPDFEEQALDPHCDDVGGLARHESGQLLACYIDDRLRLVAAWWTGSDWRFDEIEQGYSGNGSCVATFDGNAEPVVAWAKNETVRVARARGGAWQVEDVDDAAGAPLRRGALSIAVDANGRPALAMRNRDQGSVELARWTGSAWAIETVASGLVPGISTALAFDPSGAPAVAYRDDGSADESLATWNGSAWVSEVVRNVFANTHRHSLRFRDDGTAVLVMGNEIAFREPAGWQVSPLPPEILALSGDSLELTSTGAPVVLGITHVAQLFGTDWSTWPLSPDRRSVPRGPALDLAPSGEPRLAHGAYFAREVASALRVGGAWIVETARADTINAWSVSLDHDSSGLPGIVAIHDFTSALSYSSFDGTGWTSELVDPDDAWEPDLSFSPGDRPVIAYRADIGSLVVAEATGGAWQSEVVDAVSRDGAWPSLIHDSEGNAAVAYRSADLLKLARRGPGGDWTVEIVDEDWPTGEHPALALMPDGRIAISYHSDELDSPRLAIESASGWQYETIDLGRFDVERHRDLVIDGSGRIFLSQGEWASNAPQVMWREWGEWQVETVDEYRGDRSTEIELAPDGRLVVAYGGGCRSEARVTWWDPPPVQFLLVRQSIDSLVPGWRDGAFPFTRDNDDELPPFPVTARPVAVADELPSGPLVLYRALVSGGTLAAGLRVEKIGGQIIVSYP